MILFHWFGLQPTHVFQDGQQTEDPRGDPDINDYFQQPMQQQEIQHPDSQQAASQLYTTVKRMLGCERDSSSAVEQPCGSAGDVGRTLGILKDT